jgi:hypothetical protein
VYDNFIYDNLVYENFSCDDFRNRWWYKFACSNAITIHYWPFFRRRFERGFPPRCGRSAGRSVLLVV